MVKEKFNSHREKRKPKKEHKMERGKGFDPRKPHRIEGGESSKLMERENNPWA